MTRYNFAFPTQASPSLAEEDVACVEMPKAPLLSQPLSETAFAVIDTESTGADPEKDRVIELAARLWFTNPQRKAPFILESLISPGCKVPPSAMAVHHITNEMLVGAPPIQDIIAPMMDLVGDAIPVAYNAEYDRKMLRGTPLHDRYWVDLYRVAMKTWHVGEKNNDGFELGSFKQQELRYWLNLRPAPGDAHRAAADIFVSGLVLQAAVDKFLGAGMPDDAATFLTWVEAPIMHKTIPFGQNAGMLPEQMEDYELRRAFDLTNKMYESFARFNVHDFLRPEMMRRALSENISPRPRRDRGGPR